MELFLKIVCVSILFATLGLTEEEHRIKKAKLITKYMKKHKKQEGAVRLVNGNNNFEGNVEVFHDGEWGSICDDEWDSKEAIVVCKQLGFPSAIRTTHSSMYGKPNNKYWMDNLYCIGEEKRISECRFDGWGHNDCGSDEAAGVVCENIGISSTTSSPQPLIVKKPKIKIQEVMKEKIEVRVAGGRVKDEGRIEVRMGNSDWGNICSDGWSLLEAGVVCRQLGFGYAMAAVQTNYFSGNVSKITLSGVECRGNEERLEDCSMHHHNDLDCPGPQDSVAGAICTRVMADLAVDAEELMRSAYLEDRQLFFLQCAMEENCLASGAYEAASRRDEPWHMETRRLLRFTARILNKGTADFRPAQPKHLWEFHQCHMHYHSMEVFATFDVLRGSERVAEGHKASFCLEDNQCLPGVKPRFACANYGDQGISVNCSDIYKHNIDCQWVDISELLPGTYTLKIAINPEFKVAEQSFENNAAICQMHYSTFGVRITNCYITRP